MTPGRQFSASTFGVSYKFAGEPVEDSDDESGDEGTFVFDGYNLPLRAA